MKSNHPTLPSKRHAAQLEITLLAISVIQSLANITATIFVAPAGAPVTAIVLVSAILAAIPFVAVRSACRLVRIQRAQVRRGAK